MYRDKSTALVIPARNEEKLIRPTLESVPEYVDRVYVVDDGSQDTTQTVVSDHAEKDSRVQLIAHGASKGPGAAIITGYLQAYQDDHDVVAVVGGDHQMPLEELQNFLDPLIDGVADYTKGNRFMNQGNALQDMPKMRLFGNTIISLLTKISSGYYQIFDVVDGYTAITKEAIGKVNWEEAWGGYGYPMDFLLRMSINHLRVLDIPRRAIYLEGQRQSQIKGFSYALKVSPMLLSNFFTRLHSKYLFSNFHPLVFLYYGGLLSTALGLLVGGYILLALLVGQNPTGATAAFCTLLMVIGVQGLFFGLLLDILENNKQSSNK